MAQLTHYLFSKKNFFSCKIKASGNIIRNVKLYSINSYGFPPCFLSVQQKENHTHNITHKMILENHHIIKSKFITKLTLKKFIKGVYLLLKVKWPLVID